MSDAATWVVAGLVLAGLEMLVPGFFLMWIGLGAMGAGAAAAVFGLGQHGTIGVFVGVTVVLVGLAAVRLRRGRGPDLVNAPSAGLIGRTCRAIEFRDGEGRVSLGDGAWTARVLGRDMPEAGQAMVVVGLEGTALLVAAKGQEGENHA